MALNARLVLVPFLIYCSHLPEIFAANANPNYNKTNEIELLKRIKAADIKSWMDMTADPCNDFYKYACGNWERINAGELRQQGSISKYDVYNSGMEKRLDHFIKHLSTGDDIQSKIHDYVESCKDVKAKPLEYRIAMKNLLREVFTPPFSCLKYGDHMKPTLHFNWWYTVAKAYNLYDETILVNIDVDYDLKSRGMTRIYVGKPEKMKYHTTNGVTKRIFNKYFGAYVKDAEEIGNDVYEFSEAIRNAGVDHTMSGLSVEEQFTLIKVTDFQKKYKSFFDLETYLKTALNISQVPTEIYLETGGYFDDIIKVFNNTKPETVEHYILLFIMAKFAVNIDEGNIDDICRDKANWYFGKYIQHSIYEEFRSNDFEKQIYELWHDIKSVFRDDLQSLKYQWISKASRDHAIKKLDNIKFKISSYDDENFDKFFQNLHIDPSKHAHNVHNILKQFTALRGAHLEIRKETLQDINIAAYTPIYMPTRNEIRIPVSFLQRFHIWHSSYPKAILYAHIGAPVAHEMIHAFDDSGRHFDADGNANNWWDDNAAEEFEIRRRCFQSQYHNYTFAGFRLPDLPAQGENIADNAAVKIAYLAYIRCIERAKYWGKPTDETFKNWPNTSGEEIFFISFGQYRCQGLDKDLIRETIVDDVHAPHSLRVMGPLSNFPKFSEVFKCHRGANMNPLRKCEIF